MRERERDQLFQETKQKQLIEMNENENSFFLRVCVMKYHTQAVLLLTGVDCTDERRHLQRKFSTKSGVVQRRLDLVVTKNVMTKQFLLYSI